MTIRSLAHSLPFLACFGALAACGGGASDAESSTAAETSSGDEASLAAPATETGSFLPGQGESAIGVYFVVVGPEQADGGRGLVAELEARGVSAGVGQLSCDQGAAESLRRSPDDVVVSAAFRTRADAERFVTAWGRDVIGIADFVAFCRD